MGQFFAFGLILYMLMCAALMPVIMVDGYMKNRDCKVANKVAQCVIEYVPFKEPTP